MSATRNTPKSVDRDEEIVAPNVVESEEDNSKKAAEKTEATDAVTETLAATSLDTSTEEPVAETSVEKKEEETEAHEAAAVPEATEELAKEETHNTEAGITESNERTGALSVRAMGYHKSSSSLYGRRSPSRVQEETQPLSSRYSPT
jgi:hypothetical protein